MHKPPAFLLDACAPIHLYFRQYEKYHITNFIHDITYGHGEITMLTTQEDMIHFYNYHQIPIACTNESGRLLADGIYTSNMLTDQYQECAILFSTLLESGFKCGLNYGQQSLHYVERHDQCQHLYSIFFDLPEHEFIHFVINNGNLLQDMIAQYQSQTGDLILEAKHPPNRMHLPSSINMYQIYKNMNGHPISQAIYQYEKKQAFRPELPLNNSEHTQLNQIRFNKNYSIQLDSRSISITRSEIKILFELIKGKHAGEIAHVIGLKQDTVEKYLATIKQKFGVSRKSELIEKISLFKIFKQIYEVS